MKKKFYLLLFLLSLLLQQCVFGQGTGFSYIRELTIQASEIPDGSDLPNFPVLVKFTDPTLRSVSNGGRVNSSNGYDIAFFLSACSTPLDHQLDDYNPLTGEVNAWVRIPLLSTTADTKIYIHYGNPSVIAPTSVATTWNAGYSAIWHFGNDPSDPAPQVQDATSNGHHGTANGGMTVANLLSGKIGKALHFDEINDYVQVPDFLYGQELTISFWFNLGEVNGTTYQYAFSHGAWAAPNSLNVYIGEDNIPVVAEIPNRQMLKTVFRDVNDANNFDVLDAGSSYVDGNWHYYTIRIQDFGGATIFIDGVAVANYAVWGANTFDPTTDLFWGGREDLNAGRFYGGLLDEGRVSSVWRTSNWIRTEYNNQHLPASFVTVGTEISSATLCFPLALGFTDFTAQQKGSLVTLNWSADKSEDQQRFIIERSYTGSTWLRVAEVIAKNFYIDTNNNKGPIFYRIRYTKDGENYVSDTRTVKGVSQDELIHIYPNPGRTGQVKIEFQGTIKKGGLRLLSTAGGFLGTLSFSSSSSGFYNLDLPSGLTPGIYFLQIDFSDRKPVVKKIIIQ